jgi:hypothetical protein
MENIDKALSSLSKEEFIAYARNRKDQYIPSSNPSLSLPKILKKDLQDFANARYKLNLEGQINTVMADSIYTKYTSSSGGGSSVVPSGSGGGGSVAPSVAPPAPPVRVDPSPATAPVPASGGVGPSSGGPVAGSVPIPTQEMGQALRIYTINPIEKKAHLRKYMSMLGFHKITDMKHDHLDIDNTFPHFHELIPKVSTSLFGQNGNFPAINDDAFLIKHLKLINNGTEIPIDGLNSLVTTIGNLDDTSNISLEIHYDNYDTSTVAEPIYIFSNIKKIKYDDIPDAKTFLDTLDIATDSILNVDFQYKLWDILKKGANPDYATTTIYLKKTSENENDPAGKFNILDTTFRKASGVKTHFAIGLEQVPSLYKSFDDRFAIWDEKPDTTLASIIDTESPDFFSRFEVATGPLIPLKTCFGYFDRFSAPITISDKYVGFTYTSDSKQDNSNANVRAKIDKLYKEKKSNYLVALACEAGKKGSGDDLQILSQRKTKMQLFKILDPTTIALTGNNDAYSQMKNPANTLPLTGKEYFVSHDGPTCVRDLIEGCNLLLMHVSGWAIKFERGPPIVIPIQTKIAKLYEALTKPTFRSSLTGELNVSDIQVINSPEYNYLKYCLQISMFYNNIIRVFIRQIEDKINSSITQYEQEHTPPQNSQVRSTRIISNKIFPYCKQVLFDLLCLCNILQYFPFLNEGPFDFARIDIDTIIARERNAEYYNEEDDDVLSRTYSNLQQVYKLQQLQLEGYKNLTKYIDLTVGLRPASFSLDMNKLKKNIELTSEGRMLANWDINYNPIQKSRNIDPLQHPLNLAFIDKLSEYLPDELKQRVITLFDTYKLASIFEGKNKPIQQSNCASFEANILCKLSIKVPDDPTFIVMPLPTEIAVNDQSSTEVSNLDEKPNEFDPINDISQEEINIEVDPQLLGGKPNRITGGMKLRSDKTIYTYCGNQGQQINRASHDEIIPANITSYTDLFSNLYNTLFYDLTSHVFSSILKHFYIINTDIFLNYRNLLEEEEIITELQEYVKNIRDDDYDKLVIDFRIFVHKFIFDKLLKITQDIQIQIHYGKIIFAVLIILILTYITVPMAFRGGSKEITDNHKEQISPLKDSYLLINNMFDTMQNKMIDNSYLNNFIIHMILNKQMMDIYDFCNKAMHSTPSMDIFKMLFKDKIIPDGFSESIHEIQSNFMETINLCLSNILFLLAAEEDGCKIIEEDAFEISSSDANLSFFHFINRQSLYLILGSITIPPEERETRYKQAKAAFESPYWKFFYQMIGGKEYIVRIYNLFTSLSSAEHYKMIDFLSKLDMRQIFTIEYIESTLGQCEQLDPNNRKILYKKYNQFCSNFQAYGKSMFEPAKQVIRISKTRKAHSARLHKDVDKKILRIQSAPSIFPKTSFTRKKKLPSKINTSSPEIPTQALPRSISPKKSIEIEAIPQTPNPKIKLSTTISPTKQNKVDKTPPRFKQDGYKYISENDDYLRYLKRKKDSYTNTNKLKRTSFFKDPYNKKTRKANLLEQ